MPLRTQRYQRSFSPQPIRLTARDNQILETIHAFDGLLSLRQIDRVFFSGQGRSQPRTRMRALFNHGYVQMPDATTMHQVPLKETVYWLDRRGAALVAGLQGLTLAQFKWRSRPKYSQLQHDLRVNDVRIAVREACQSQLEVGLGLWLPESEFAVQPDRIMLEAPFGRSVMRTIRPDGYFVINRGKLFAFLLEIDMGSEDNPRFGREKVRPGVAYLKSPEYARRFGIRHGRYLIVTTGQRRMLNMKSQAERTGGKGLFYFVSFDDLSDASILTDPVWLLAGHKERRSLIPQ